MPHSLETAQPDFEARFADFLAAKRETEEAVDQTVAVILAEVRERGDAAVLEYTERFDRLSLLPEELRIAEREIGTAKAACAEAELAALAEAAARITDYHRRQVPEDLDYRDAAGVRLGHRWTALASAGRPRRTSNETCSSLARRKCGSSSSAARNVSRASSGLSSAARWPASSRRGRGSSGARRTAAR